MCVCVCVCVCVRSLSGYRGSVCVCDHCLAIEGVCVCVCVCEITVWL